MRRCRSSLAWLDLAKIGNIKSCFLWRFSMKSNSNSVTHCNSIAEHNYNKKYSTLILRINDNSARSKFHIAARQQMVASTVLRNSENIPNLKAMHFSLTEHRL